LAKSKWRASRVIFRRSHSRLIVSCASATSGPVTRTAKSKRGSSRRPWVGSRKSSSRLMPPQKTMRASTTTSLRCSRRQRRGISTRQPRAGLYTRHCSPAACQRACHSAGTSPVPMPSTTTRTRRPRAAARSSASATFSGAPANSKM
jgi:hypothetical protein